MRHQTADHQGGIGDQVLALLVDVGLEAMRDRVSSYYASVTTTALFLDGTESAWPHDVTAADLFAVSMLGVTVTPRVAWRVLHETSAYADIASALAAREIHVDRDLGTADEDTLSGMLALHRSIERAVGEPTCAGPAPPLASALCARKRPEWFPVRDPGVQRLLGLDATSDLRDQWRVYRGLLNLARLMSFVTQTFTQQPDPNLARSVDVFPLRRLEMTLALALPHTSRATSSPA